MNTAGSVARVVRCPACGGKSVYAPENAYRPFCSARCRQHDFGAWATEDYRIARRENDDEEADAALPPADPGTR
jgi:endogenous inhibitor of DNA gyrase (YacG/DUF329 family)